MSWYMKCYNSIQRKDSQLKKLFNTVKNKANTTSKMMDKLKHMHNQCWTLLCCHKVRIIVGWILFLCHQKWSEGKVMTLLRKIQVERRRIHLQWTKATFSTHHKIAAASFDDQTSNYPQTITTWVNKSFHV